MQYTGRLMAVGVVALFNVIRFFYYHRYLGLPFRVNFFILTAFFLAIAWLCGKQFDRVKYYSEKDPLTGTYNRRTTEKYFQKTSRIYKRKNQELGVILLDLNNFKEVNDTYGHHVGDELLIHVATLLRNKVNKAGVVARWGGDEFLILLPDCTQKFKSGYVRDLHQTLVDGKFDKYPSVRASFGYSVYPKDGQSFEELVQKADEVMYSNKSTDR